MKKLNKIRTFWFGDQDLFSVNTTYQMGLQINPWKLGLWVVIMRIVGALAKEQ